MAQYGYDFYFKIGSEVLTLPITPAELSIKMGSNNEVVTLINEGDINILKTPSLVEIEFDARFPMRKYPYSRNPRDFDSYMRKFMGVKTGKKTVIFKVVRTTPSGKVTWYTTRRVTIEDLNFNENASEGDDVIVTFRLKEYREYGSVILPKSSNKKTTSTANKPRPNDGKGETSTTYTIQSGDCLWNIAKAAYGDATKWKQIYEANKSLIESTAKQHRNGSGSSNGHWIYPGTKLVIPGTNASNLNVEKLW